MRLCVAIKKTDSPVRAQNERVGYGPGRSVCSREQIPVLFLRPGALGPAYTCFSGNCFTIQKNLHTLQQGFASEETVCRQSDHNGCAGPCLAQI